MATPRMSLQFVQLEQPPPAKYTPENSSEFGPGEDENHAEAEATGGGPEFGPLRGSGTCGGKILKQQ